MTNEDYAAIQALIWFVAVTSGWFLFIYIEAKQVSKIMRGKNERNKNL